MQRIVFLVCSFLAAAFGVAQEDIELVNIENKAVSAYKADSTYYYDSDYNTSVISQYTVNGDYGYNLDKPLGKVVTYSSPYNEEDVKGTFLVYSEDENFGDSIEVCYNDLNSYSYRITNLIPGHTYYYKVVQITKTKFWVKIKEGSFKAVGQIRMLNIDEVDNVRDLGGWPTQFGKSINYGILYRSASLDYILEEGIDQLVGQLGVTAELDLRGATYKWSYLGVDIPYGGFSNSSYLNAVSTNYLPFVNDLKWIIERLKEGRNVIFHCAAGADRTGTLAFLIEGLLGVSEVDLCRDYELTTLWIYDRPRSYSTFKDMYPYIMTFGDSSDPAQCFYNYWLSIGMTTEELDYFRQRMLEPDSISDETDVKYIASPDVMPQNQVYDLTGRKVNTIQKSGTYIVGGKKRYVNRQVL